MPTTVPAPGPSSLPPVLALLVPAAVEGSSALVTEAEAVTKDVTRLRLVDEDESGVVLEVLRMVEELRREVEVEVVRAVVVMTDGVLMVVLVVDELSVVLVLVVEGVLVVVSSVVDGSGSSDDVVGVMSGSLVLVVVGSANVLRLVAVSRRQKSTKGQRARGQRASLARRADTGTGAQRRTSGMRSTGRHERCAQGISVPSSTRCLPAACPPVPRHARPLCNPLSLFGKLTRRGRTLLRLVVVCRRRAWIVCSGHCCDRSLRYRGGHTRSLPLPFRVFVHTLPQLLLVLLLDGEGHGCNACVCNE